jgi:Tol biopolymer transport system component
VAFASFADNLVAGDANGVADIFVHDRITGVTERVSIDSSGAEGNADSLCPSISSDGQVVAFVSDASNLVGSDKNGRRDVFVHDRQTGLTERVSVDSTGGEANADSLPPSISGDGLSVAFASDATNLVAGDTNKSRDVFVHDRSTGAIERVSIRKNGHEGYADSDTNSISTDGSAVAFSSRAANLVSGDTNGVWDVFVHEFCSIAASWSNYGVGFPGTTGIPTFTSRQNPVLGTTIARDLANSYGSPTLGLLLIGFQQASLHTNRGGDLLVVPAVVIPISFSYGGDTFTGDIPRDWSLCGIRLEAQAVEADPGAAKGVSFTSGLELVLGH